MEAPLHPGDAVGERALNGEEGLSAAGRGREGEWVRVFLRIYTQI